MAESFVYHELAGPSRRYWGLLALLGVPLALGCAAYFYIEHYGHIVTGMDNQSSGACRMCSRFFSSSPRPAP
jgi:molybdopterin-containing oxidoreductase family membrane subunit